MKIGRVPIGLLLAAVAIGPQARPASATSIAAALPHDPERACEAISRLVENFNSARVRDADHLSGPIIYTDALGRVEAGEEAALLHALRNNEGRADRGPIRLYGVYPIHSDRLTAVYLAVLERQVWRENRYELDGMLNSVAVRDPRHYRETSSWLVTFYSNSIRHFREAGELFELATDAAELQDCTR